MVVGAVLPPPQGGWVVGWAAHNTQNEITLISRIHLRSFYFATRNFPLFSRIKKINKCSPDKSDGRLCSGCQTVWTCSIMFGYFFLLWFFQDAIWIRMYYINIYFLMNWLKIFFRYFFKTIFFYFITYLNIEYFISIEKIVSNFNFCIIKKTKWKKFDLFSSKIYIKIH